MIQPSRILNKKNGFLGLTYLDCSLLILLSIQLHGVFAPFEMEWVALLIGPLIAVGLISIRIKYRPGMLGSFLSFFLRSRLLRSPRFEERVGLFLRIRKRFWSGFFFLVRIFKKGTSHAS